MKLCFCLIFLVNLGCSQNKSFNTENENLRRISKNYLSESDLNKKVYLVTGLDGCGACLEYTVKFIEKNIDNKDMVFIISGQSKVQLKAKFKLATRQKSNFVCDTTLMALRSDLVSMEHPKAYFCKSGLIVDAKDITYKNADSVFHHVNQFLTKN